MKMKMSAKRILVVEDDQNISELIRVNLARAGYESTCVFSGEDAIRAIREAAPDLLLLDLMLPGVGGLDVCRLAKADKATQSMPIIMVTARGEESDIVRGLELGADDYVTKPFSPKVLLARIKSVLRRNMPPAGNDDAIIEIHDVCIHTGRHAVYVDEAAIELTASEFRLLLTLANRPGWVRTRDQIIESLHGAGYPVTDRSVDVQVVGLRKKLGNAGKLIETVRGVGYRMRDV